MQAGSERWEYLTCFLQAEAEDVRDYLRQRWPGWEAPRNAPQALNSQLERPLNHALGLPFSDFEDAVQLASAVAAGLDSIVTRDLNDFRGAPLPVLTPGAFIARKFN
jgi:predicted nucleic acid-binding protein